MSVLTPDETLLGLLAHHPQHGYMLLDTFQSREQLGLIWRMSTSQLYAVLKRLERLGWITGTEQQSDNAPPRVEYAITEAGRAVLERWLDDPAPSASVRRVRVEFLSRLYIAQLLDHPASDIIARQRAACQSEHHRLQQLQAELTPGTARLAVDMMLSQTEALVGWIDQCEGTLAPRA